MKWEESSGEIGNEMRDLCGGCDSFRSPRSKPRRSNLQLALPGHAMEMAGDDIRGYSDTPQLPNQRWKVHDMGTPASP